MKINKLMPEMSELDVLKVLKSSAGDPDALDKINQLKIRNFNYKKDSEDMPISILTGNKYEMNMSGTKLITGVIAQEVEEIFPSCVSEDGHGVKSVKGDEIHWAAIKAIQELSAEVEELKQQINS